MLQVYLINISQILTIVPNNSKGLFGCRKQNPLKSVQIKRMFIIKTRVLSWKPTAGNIARPYMK